jgi:hypothetical protein
MVSKTTIACGTNPADVAPPYQWRRISASGAATFRKATKGLSLYVPNRKRCPREGSFVGLVVVLPPGVKESFA